ncbi:hypothetical protein [Desulfovibrio sp.]|nr:hypothetical protein [Desulfovibrio sp.]
MADFSPGLRAPRKHFAGRGFAAADKAADHSADPQDFSPQAFA